MIAMARMGTLIAAVTCVVTAGPPASPRGFESRPMQVRAIQPDGTLVLGDGQVVHQVVMRWVRLPEPYMTTELRQTIERLTFHLPITAWVRLWTPDSRWDLDKQGRIRALVLMGPSGNESLQGLLVRDGCAAYSSRKDVELEKDIHNDLMNKLKTAKVEKRGIWYSAPGWALENSDLPKGKRDPEEDPLRNYRRRRFR